MGGSPCQGFSFAGKQLNFDDVRSKLFFEYARLLKETGPKYFLFENVVMKQEYQDVISEYLGVRPIEINSNLVSAQHRSRLYWTNIPNVPRTQCIEVRATNLQKSNCLTTVAKDNALTPLGVGCHSDVFKKKLPYRYYTLKEYCRLQTLPDGYLDGISEHRAKKCIGNGWTVDVIAHILSYIKQ